MIRRLPLFVALALGLLVFGPAFWQGTSVFFGREYVDAWGTQWFYWYVGHQFEAAKGLGHTDLLFFPWGKDVYFHTGGNILDAILAWPLRWVLGPVAGYNVWILGIVATNALAMRSLARALLRRDRLRPLLPSDALAADLAGVLFAFNPYLLHEIRDGRPTQALLVFLLLFWREYLRLGDEPRVRIALLAGLWLALTGLTYWFYALFAGLAAVAVAVVRIRRGPRGFALHALAGLAAGVLVSPFVLPMLSSAEVPGLLDVSKWTLTTWSPTTIEGVKIGVYVFNPASLTSGFFAIRAHDSGLEFLPEDRNVLWVQVALLGLGVLTAARRMRWAALAVLAVGFFIAIGPSVHFEAAEVANVPYLALVQVARVFQRLWWPSRALVIATIAGGLFAAWALAALLRRGRAGLGVAVGAAVLWGVELEAAKLVPMDIWPAGIPEGYRCLSDADEGAVLELPYAHSQAHLYYQTAHGLPIFGGMVEDNPVFAPAGQVAIRKENSFVSVLLDQASDADSPPDYTPEDRAALGALGYRYVLIDKRAYLAPGYETARVGPSHEGRVRYVRRTFNGMLGAPVFEDDQTIIYAPWGAASPCPDRAPPAF